MKISIYVKPNSRVEKIEQTPDGLTVYVNAPPQNNRANHAVIDLLADYFKVIKSRVKIKLGLKSKRKLIEIN